MGIIWDAQKNTTVATTLECTITRGVSEPNFTQLSSGSSPEDKTQACDKPEVPSLGLVRAHKGWLGLGLPKIIILREK